MRKLSVENGKVVAERETDEGLFTLEASLPAVVSVNEKINEPRFPSFKGIMAAKKKEVTKLTLAEIGVEADEVGVANAGSKVLSSTPKPRRPRVRRSPTRATAAPRSPSTWSVRKSSSRSSLPYLRNERHPNG